MSESLSRATIIASFMGLLGTICAAYLGARYSPPPTVNVYKDGGSIKISVLDAYNDTKSKLDTAEKNNKLLNTRLNACEEKNKRAIPRSVQEPTDIKTGEQRLPTDIRIIDINTRFRVTLGEVVFLSKDRKVIFSTRRSSYKKNPVVGIVDGKAQGMAPGVPWRILGNTCDISLHSADSENKKYDFYLQCD